MTSLITVSPLDSIQLSPTQDAITKRDDLLALAARGRSVPNADSAEKATAILRDITNFIRLIEASRKDAKAPVLELGKKIDEVGYDLTHQLKDEATRINGLISAFAAAEAERERQALIKAREEEQRLIREQQAKERAEMEKARAAQEAAARKQAELEEKASRARSAERRAEFEAQAAKVKEAAEAAAAEAAAKADAEVEATIEKVAEQRLVASGAARTKIGGTALRMEVKFEIEDIYALYEAAPGLVILSANNAAIKAQLKNLPAGASLPGVKHWKEAKTTIR
jgi:DNA repair exonuclease SbcCD ATPase subunit